MKTRMFVCLLGAFFLLNACGVQQVEQPLDQVTVQLKWVHQAQFAGLYIAEEKGYYHEENIDVTFVEGGPDINHLESVTEGEAMFAITSSNEVFIAIDEGKKIKAIATILQRSPLVFVSMADSDITDPRDFIGRKVAVFGKTDYEIQLKALAQLLEFDFSQINLVDHSYGFESLTEGRVDVQGFYSTGGLIRLRDAGYQVNLIWPSDYGLHLNSDCIITTNALINENPELILRFLKATLKGWEYAVGNAEDAVDATMKYALEADRDLQEKMMAASVPLIHTGENEIGWMDEKAWRNVQNLSVDYKSIKSKIDLDEVIDQDYLFQIYDIEE